MHRSLKILLTRFIRENEINFRLIEMNTFEFSVTAELVRRVTIKMLHAI